MNNSLVDFWQAAISAQKPCEPPAESTKFPFEHPSDNCHLDCKTVKTIDQKRPNIGTLVTRMLDGKVLPEAVHRSLMPIPYSGDLANARIFLLMANPSLSWSSYSTERRHEAALGARIEQNFSNCEYPLSDLDPNLADTGSFSYWEPRLRPFIEIAARSSKRRTDAIAQVAKRVAIVERFPYRSFSMPWSKNIEAMPSVLAARDYVYDDLLPRAEKEEIAIVVVRRARQWFDDATRLRLSPDESTGQRPYRTIVLKGTNPQNGYLTGDWIEEIGSEFLSD